MLKRVSFFSIVLLSMLAAAAHASDFDPKAATEAYLATITGEAKAKSDAYFEGGYWLILYDAAISIGIALLLLFTRVASGLRSLAENLPWRWLQTFVFFALFIALTTALTFPYTMYVGFTREHAFGLSNQSYDEWFGEYLIGGAVGLVMGAVFFTILYAIIRRAPNTWWIWGAGATSLFFAFAALIAPVFISPLFNEYKPMRDGELKQEILSLARANGIPVNDVFEVDASKQTKRISANVQGFLGTTRISLNDNLLNRGTPAEVRAVMAHEMGHYALGHVNELIAYASILSLIAFAIAHFGFHALTGSFGGLWGIRDIADPAGFAVLSLMLSIIGLVGTPITNSVIRMNEAEADIYGLNAAREPDGFATIALKLAEYRKLDPTPWEEFVFYDHPSGRSRVSMAMHWKAENLNERSSVPVAAQPAAQGAPPTAETPPTAAAPPAP
ncbi:MAG: M48 family metallopeptidase [Alphaproteobacteria bacterium]|nr:M48 family metallopeptidase [Alphaproteobacteria bacterium]